MKEGIELTQRNGVYTLAYNDSGSGVSFQGEGDCLSNLFVDLANYLADEGS